MRSADESLAGALRAAAPRRRRNPWLNFLVRLFGQKRLGAVGFVICLVLVFIAIFANLISPYEYRMPNTDEALFAPGWTHWMGTDQLGRDIFSRILVGAQVSIIVSFSCVVLFLVMSIIIGLGSGYLGGKVDIVVQRFVDGVMSIPTLILLLALITILGQGVWQIVVVLSIDRGISTSRVLRGEALWLKEATFVEAAQCMGANRRRIFLVHILPNTIGPMVVMATISLGAFILQEATLSFLGYGIPPPSPTWGSMLSFEGVTYMQVAPWMAIFPGLALTLAVWAFNVLGDALRDLLDPRLRSA